MEIWSEIRREVLTGALSKRAAIAKYKVGWHTLKKMLAHDEPPGYQRAKQRPKPKLDVFLPLIRQMLEDDGKAPPKQKHTARRIFERLRDEHGYTGGETVVKDAVREWRISRREVFLPLSHPPGEAQVDFGEATIRIAGQETKVALFVMTLPYSGAMFVQAFPKECTETFMEGHRRAFEEFGGVPTRISYDNSAIAVIEVLKGRERKLTREFLRLQSHYLFTEHFCLVRRANEKGHVERLLGTARKRFLVPVPDVDSIKTLNRHLVEACRRDLDERTRGRSGTKRELLRDDSAAFLPLPPSPFESRRVADGTVSSESLVRFETNDYSVPVRYAHRKVIVIATVDEVRLIYEDRLLARYPRCWDRERTFFEPVHYLALLERKPGGFDHAKPLEQWNLPECFALLRRRMEADDPKSGTRSFIRVLRLLERFSLEEVAAGVEYSLDIGLSDADSIRSVVEHRADGPVRLFSLDGRPHLACVRVETTPVVAYQALLTEAAS
ncbi:MAG: IS21 family transposase [Thermoleophilia bacterium]